MPLQRGEVRGYDFNRMVVEFTMLNRDKIRRLASALGEWPWTDVFMSSETSKSVALDALGVDGGRRRCAGLIRSGKPQSCHPRRRRDREAG